MKKVFKKKAFIDYFKSKGCDSNTITILVRNSPWVNYYEGLTRDELIKLGILPMSEWLVEEN